MGDRGTAQEPSSLFHSLVPLTPPVTSRVRVSSQCGEKPLLPFLCAVGLGAVLSAELAWHL